MIPHQPLFLFVRKRTTAEKDSLTCQEAEAKFGRAVAVEGCRGKAESEARPRILVRKYIVCHAFEGERPAEDCVWGGSARVWWVRVGESETAEGEGRAIFGRWMGQGGW